MHEKKSFPFSILFSCLVFFFTKSINNLKFLNLYSYQSKAIYMYMWAISCVSFACMWCICLFNVTCFHYNRVDKGYTLRLMSLLCCCFYFIDHFSARKYSEATLVCFFLGGIFYFFHWDIYVVVFYTVSVQR